MADEKSPKRLQQIISNKLIRRIFEQRGVQSFSELDYSLKNLLPPDKLKDIEKAAALIQQILCDRKKILIVGDYDVDGAAATALAIIGLQQLGARYVDFFPPDRFKYGYGLSVKIAEQICNLPPDSKPDLVITVDNGISNIDGVAALRAANISVIITDHHLPGAQLPAANAIINPNQPGCEFESKNLAGVGVMFYLLLAVRSQLRRINWFTTDSSAANSTSQIPPPEPKLVNLLDLVALGTVADMVGLDYNNRIMVSQGLRRVRAGLGRPGINALIAIAGKQLANLKTADFGFVIGPRLNAAGRMQDASVSIKCLLSSDAQAANHYAKLLDEINRRRRQVQTKMQTKALQIVDKLENQRTAINISTENKSANNNHINNKTAGQIGFCLYDKNWHQGIVGLVAARVVEKFHQPAIAFAAESTDENILVGSARSISGLHMRDLLANIATDNPHLMQKFGGHAMAAGLTIAKQDLANFTEIFYQLVGKHFNYMQPTCEILTDGGLNCDELTVDNALLIRKISPWGLAFPPPIFDGEFQIRHAQLIKERHLKMRLIPQTESTINPSAQHAPPTYNAIMFNYSELHQGMPPNKIKAVYELHADEFNNQLALQLIVQYMQPI